MEYYSMHGVKMAMKKFDGGTWAGAFLLPHFCMKKRASQNTMIDNPLPFCYHVS